jgi:hypothetical protein
VSRGYDEEDADQMKVRANRSHTIRWKANALRWNAGEQQMLYEDLPVIGGKLSLDASNPTRRTLSLEIAGVGNLVPDQPSDPLACFGQFIRLWCTIDREDGTWFPWIYHGEFPILTTTSEWPSLKQTIECGDLSTIVDDDLHVKKRAYGHMTVYEAIKELTEHGLPDRLFAIDTHDGVRHTKVEPHTVADAASSRWEVATNIAAARGFEVFFDWRGRLVIRDAITAADNDVIPAVGPDIGSVSSPVATLRDGTGGNLIAITQAITREGACNGVFINLNETASQTLRRHGRLVSGDKRVNVQVSALATGATAWGDRYGRQPIVIERPVKVITDDVVAAQRRRAKRLLNRRGGVIRSLEMDVVGAWWVEPDDRVHVMYGGRSEYHYIASIELTLDGSSATHIRTRSLAVDDPG